MEILSGHVSPETAYVVEDYPYGFRLRCRIRYWLEYAPKRGFRFVSFRDTYGAGVPEAGRACLDQWVAAKVAYDANRKAGDPLAVGLEEAHKAWLDEALKVKEIIKA